MVTTILIPSATDPAKRYTVTLGPRSSTCTCPDYLYRRADKGEACRHIRQAEQQIRAGRYRELELKAGSVDDETLPKLIEKYRQQPGPVLLALLGEQFDRELLPVPVPMPAFPALETVLANARNWGRQQKDARLKAIFA